jgi:hypothetical protein
MTALEWDKVGDRRYETGIDRGVLFVKGGPAVPWNGLSSVTEAVGRDVKSYYLDGVKYLDHHVPGSYSAKLAAFTYSFSSIDPALLATIELLLYGGPTTGTGTPDDPIVQNDPSLPSFIDLIRMLDAVEVPT